MIASKSEKYGVEWKLDADAHQCAVCSVAFGLLERKHHCRVSRRVRERACH
jgi:hypothetical protein